MRTGRGQETGSKGKREGAAVTCEIFRSLNCSMRKILASWNMVSESTAFAMPMPCPRKMPRMPGKQEQRVSSCDHRASRCGAEETVAQLVTLIARPGCY